MNKSRAALYAFASSTLITGCTGLKPKVDIEKLPVTAAGVESEYIIDNADVGFYTDGQWKRSSVSSGYIGSDYLAAEAGSGEKAATWNLNIVKAFDVFARWTSHSNRGSNVKYVVHHLDDQNYPATTMVEVDQREFGGEWFKLGTFRMSTLTGRVTVSNDSDGYVIADAVMFKEVPKEQSVDADNDGMLDAWELEHGLDSTDPMDAELDPDQDGLTNLQEFLALTDPLDSDTDGDRLPDGYEVESGLDPTVSDGDKDSDADGYSNYQEYLAGTDPNDAQSVLPANSVLVTWEPPTTRTDGGQLTPEDIAYYELNYSRTQTAGDELVADNGSSQFVAYGPDIRSSTATSGYIGDDYAVMPAGTGENSATWTFEGVAPASLYSLAANWTSHQNRATNADYKVVYDNESGLLVEDQYSVDQTTGGGQWQKLGEVQSASGALSVTLTNDANGYVVADAVKLVPATYPATTVRIDSDTTRSYVVNDLSAGEWEFKIRAVDVSGAVSDYSESQVKVIE